MVRKIYTHVERLGYCPIMFHAIDKSRICPKCGNPMALLSVEGGTRWFCVKEDMNDPLRCTGGCGYSEVDVTFDRKFNS